MMNLDEAKIEIVINVVVNLLQKCPPGYTFDAVEILPYPNVGNGIAYNLWLRDPNNEKLLGYSDVISMLICHGEKGSFPEEYLKRLEEDVRNGKYRNVKQEGVYP